MKKVLCLLLVAIMAVTSLVSCGSSLEEGEKGAIIKMCLTTLPDTFDPSAYSIDSDSAKVYSLMYMGLTTINGSGKLSAGIAYEWGYFYDSVYNEDKMYFQMYETGWNDGRRVSSSDFVYAWNRILAPESNSPYASLLYPIKNAKLVKMGEMTEDDLGLEAVDDTRLEITFEEGYVKDNGKAVAEQFATTVANIAFAPLREDKMNDNWTYEFSVTSIMSCGPYILRSYNNTKDQRKIELERNVYYRRDAEDKDEPLDKHVTPYKIIFDYDTTGNDLADAAKQYDEGNIFYLGEFNKDTYASYGNKISSKDSLSSYVYYFNTNNALFKDAKVRKALSIALDRNEIANIAGCGASAATGFVPAGVFNTKKGTSFRTEGPDVYSTSAKVDEAKSLLKEAGVSKGSFSISYVAESESDTNKLIAEYAKGVWEKLGFTVTLNAMPWSVDKTSGKIREVIANAEGNSFDVLAVDLNMGSVDASAHLLQFAENLSGNYVVTEGDKISSIHFTGFNSSEYNELAGSVLAESDAAARAGLLHQLEAKLADECPATALIFYKNSYVASSKLSGYGTYYNGAPTFFEVELEGWRDINAKIEAEEAAAAEAAKDKE